MSVRRDVWKALSGTLAYMLIPSTSHAPKRNRGRKRPGCPDMWQIPYLGVASVFSTSDEWMAEAVAKISTLLRFPRRAFLT